MWLIVLIPGLMVLIAGCGSGASSTVVPPSPPEAIKLAFTTQPVGAIAGSALDTQPAVAVEDAEGNIVTSYQGLVVLTITASTGASEARLFGGTKVRLVNGMVEFRDLSIYKAGSGYTLTVTCSNLAPATSKPFTILPGPPAQLAFTTQPSGGVAGSPLTTQPVVTVQDLYGNTVTGYEGSVRLSATITIDSETSAVAIYGTTTIPVVNSVAQFTDISADKSFPGYKLTAFSDSLQPATSKSFTISPAAPAKLEFTVQPEGSEAGTPFETQPKVAIEDIYGNVVTSSRASIILSITPGSGTDGAVLSGTTTLIAEDGFGGLAEFTNLSIDRAGSAYMLTATSSGLPSVTSQAFDVSAP
jgi:hypothetical protein